MNKKNKREMLPKVQFVKAHKSSKSHSYKEDKVRQVESASSHQTLKPPSVLKTRSKRERLKDYLSIAIVRMEDLNPNQVNVTMLKHLKREQKSRADIFKVL